MNLRAFKAIFLKAFGKNGNGGAKATKTTFAVSVLFVVATCALVMNVFMGLWAPRYFYDRDNYNIVAVNAPTTFKHFSSGHQYGTVQVFYKEHDAMYDFLTFDDYMKDSNAFMAIVFPVGFDTAVSEGRQCEVLTYIRTDEHIFASRRDSIEDGMLKDYQDYLKSMTGIPVYDDNIIILDNPILTNNLPPFMYFVNYMGKVIVPLVAFITMLYIGMSKGTNAVAGQKEKGTLTGILLTPTPVTTITLGNLCGIWLSSLLPVIAASPLLLIFPGFRHIENIICYILLALSASLLISAITLLISVINDNVVSAQTAFLPVFFILLSICIICIQSIDDVAAFYMWLPIYGQFYGMGRSIANDSLSLIDTLICCLSTSTLSGICFFLSDRFLRTERYTTTVESLTDKKAAKYFRKKSVSERKSKQKPKDIIFDYLPRRRKNAYKILVHNIRFPLIVLSLTQLIAIIPAIISLSRQRFLFDMISDLRDVADMSGIVNAVFDAFAALMAQPVFMFFMGIGYWLLIAVYLLKVKFIEKNPLHTTGLPTTPVRGIINYLKGIVLGLVMMSSVVLILVTTGIARFTSFGIPADQLGLFFLYILMWLPQGFSEELMFRGYMMPRLAPRFGKAFAVFFSSLLFGVFHAANKGFSVLALINLILIAVAYALICLYTDDILMTSAAHTVWNFAQGNLYGLEVSGNSAAASLIHTTYKDGVSSLLTGGTFGPEGGLAVTLVSGVVIGITLLLLRKKAASSAASASSAS